jgi:hypothetical protein
LVSHPDISPSCLFIRQNLSGGPAIARELTDKRLKCSPIRAIIRDNRRARARARRSLFEHRFIAVRIIARCFGNIDDVGARRNAAEAIDARARASSDK